MHAAGVKSAARSHSWSQTHFPVHACMFKLHSIPWESAVWCSRVCPFLRNSTAAQSRLCCLPPRRSTMELWVSAHRPRSSPSCSTPAPPTFGSLLLIASVKRAVRDVTLPFALSVLGSLNTSLFPRSLPAAGIWEGKIWSTPEDDSPLPGLLLCFCPSTSPHSQGRHWLHCQGSFCTMGCLM